MLLKGKCALITGGNSGIGLATARRFVAEGARVAITGRDAATLAAAANELGVTAIRSDVLDAQARSSLFDRIKENDRISSRKSRTSSPSRPRSTVPPSTVGKTGGS
jgi:NAD(P)-dependent dehydrogenase (short-subunit alcohol dehydrogenase family)